jgi:hypothetical protein
MIQIHDRNHAVRGFGGGYAASDFLEDSFRAANIINSAHSIPKLGTLTLIGFMHFALELPDKSLVYGRSHKSNPFMVVKMYKRRMKAGPSGLARLPALSSGSTALLNRKKRRTGRRQSMQRRSPATGEVKPDGNKNAGSASP